MCGLMVSGPRAGQMLPILAGISSTYCVTCAAVKHQEIAQHRAKRRAQQLLADPSPITALLPPPASPTEAESMSHRIAQNVINRSNAKGTTLLVEIVLAHLADDSGYVTEHAQWEIAQLARCDKGSAVHALKWLDRQGHISIWHGHGGEPNRYQFGMDYVIEHDSPADTDE